MCHLCLYYVGRHNVDLILYEVWVELFYQNKMKQKLKKLLITAPMFLRAVCSPVFRGLDTVHNASSATVVGLNTEDCLTVIGIVGFYPLHL